MLNPRQYHQMRMGIVTADHVCVNGYEHVSLKAVNSIVNAYMSYDALTGQELGQMLCLIDAQAKVAHAGSIYVPRHNSICIAFEFVEWDSQEERANWVKYLTEQDGLATKSNEVKIEPPVLMPTTLLDRVKWVISGTFKSRV